MQGAYELSEETSGHGFLSQNKIKRQCWYGSTTFRFHSNCMNMILRKQLFLNTNNKKVDIKLGNIVYVTLLITSEKLFIKSYKVVDVKFR